MKIENLKEGMVVKSYRALCKILEVDEKGGTSKDAQMKEFGKHVRYEQEKYKFIIREIYSTPVEKQDGRGLSKNSHSNQKGAYGKYIRLLVLNILSQEQNENNSKKNKIVIGKTAMLRELNMINQNYKYSNYNRKAMAHYLGMDVDYIHEFFNTNTRKLRQTVETTMDRLMNNEKLIFWNTVKIINIKGVHREATDDEIEFIVNCESRTLKEMGFTGVDGVYATNRVKEYYDRVNSKFRQKHIYYTYNAYKIIFADSVYNKNEQLNYKLNIDDVVENKSELNSTVYQKFGSSAEQRHEKTTEGTTFGVSRTKYKQIVAEDNFVTNNKILINVCIDDGYESIGEEVATAWREYKASEEEVKSECFTEEELSDWDIELFVGK